MQKQKYQAYAIATQTVARTKQIVMLYDGVIRFMQQAKEAIRAKNIESRYNALIRASNVITGLQLCLDFENGGNIAKVLYSFYSTTDAKIFSIHRTNSGETCDEVIAELKGMRDVWQEIDQNASTGEMPAAPSTPEAAVSADAAAAEQDKNITLSA